MALEQQQLGRYRLLRVIGGGGMGKVYLAEDTLIDRQVAIKVIHTRANPLAAASEVTRLFYREARAIAKLDHPHILPLFDFGEEPNQGTTLTYMVMPFCQEGTLLDWLQQRGPDGIPSPQTVMYLIEQVADALQYAHDQQIIHQDVKPHNILIRRGRRSSLPDLLLADFGLAKMTVTNPETSYAVRGTPAYMAPEQWQGHPVPATDQYALAAVTYQLLTGRQVFQATQGTMMYQHMIAAPQPPSTANPYLTASIDKVVLQALAKKPEERFASVSVFAQALRQAIQESDTAPTLNMLKGDDLHATLTISMEEAALGTQKTLMLPGRRLTDIPIPAGAYNGQVLRLEGLGESSPSGGPVGALLLRIVLTPSQEAEPPPSPDQTTVLKQARPAPPADVTPTTTRRKASRGKVAAQIGVTLLMIAMSIWFVYYFANTTAGNAAGSAKATAQAAARTTSTTQAEATTTAQAYTTSTTQSIVQAQLTGTALAQVTATALATNPYPARTGTLVLNDSLIDNSQGHWDKYIDTNVSACRFTEGAYHAIELYPRHFADCFASPDFTNFTYQVEMKIINGDCGGIIFRADPATQHQFYYFRVCQDGSYLLGLYANNTLIQTLAEDFSSAIHAGLNQTNLVAVAALGNQLSLYVNHQLVITVTDSSYSHGQIAVVASAPTTQTEVAFSNAKVWKQ